MENALLDVARRAFLRQTTARKDFLPLDVASAWFEFETPDLDGQGGLIWEPLFGKGQD